MDWPTISDETRTLSYTLCAFTGAAIMFNLILLVWRAIRFRPHHSSKLLKILLLILDAAYMLSGAGMALLILYKDLAAAEWLCSVGGFVVLFCTQACMWLLVGCCVLLLLWQRTVLSSTLCIDTRPTHRWSLPVFVLSVILMIAGLALLSFLPLTKVDIFGATGEFYYLCTPLRRPGERGWEYSAIVLVLCWLVLATSTAILLAAVVLFIKHRHSLQSKSQSTPSSCMITVKRQRTTKTYHIARISITLAVDVFLWLLVLAVISTSYFSSWDALPRSRVQWLLAFLISITLMMNPVVIFVVNLVNKGRLNCISACRKSVDPALVYIECPRSLVSVSKIQGGSTQQGTLRYLAKWIATGSMDPGFGLMKVYQPCHQAKWSAELRVMSKLPVRGHPNVAQYLWQTPVNPLIATICTFTGDMLSKESSILCHQYYPDGTLQDYLLSHIHQLTEVGLHTVTRDVATGLTFLHQHHLVHNGLTTQTVYMASVSQNIGLRAVISDFENSYEVSADTLRKSPLTSGQLNPSMGQSLSSLFSISQQVDMDNNKFEPDIRSFGLITLEMLVAMGEHNQNSMDQCQGESLEDNTDGHTSCLSTVASVESRPDSTVFDAETCHQITNEDLATHTHVAGKCSCSERVTNLRVCGSSQTQTISHMHSASEVQVTPDENRTSSLAAENKSAFACVKVLKKDKAETQGESFKSLPEKQLTKELPAIPAETKDVSTSTNSLQKKAYQDSAATYFDSQHDRMVGDGVKTTWKAKEDKDEIEDRTQMSMARHEEANCKLNGASTPEPPSLDSHLLPSDNDEDVISTDETPSSLALSHSTGQDLQSASLVSFDTIYEDKESPRRYQCVIDNLQKKTYRKVNRPPVLRRRLTDPVEARKHMSMASWDGSVISGDSGIGSSQYDTYSDSSQLSAVYMHNRPGSRNAIYSESIISDGDSYSLIQNFIVKPDMAEEDDDSEDNIAGHFSHEHRSSRAVTDINRNQSSSRERLEALPDLRTRKQPCTRHHPDPQHPCNNKPGTKALDEIISSPSTKNHGNNSECKVVDKPKAKGRKPTKDRQAIRESPDKSAFKESDKANSLKEHCSSLATGVHCSPVSSCCSKCQYCGHSSRASYTSHPYIRSQYRHPVPVMPKLGVSAVTARRMSDASISSVSTQRSLDTFPGYRTPVHKPTSPHRSSGARLSYDKVLRSSHKTVHALANEDHVDSDLASDSCASLSSSVRSILQDSKLILEAQPQTHSQTTRPPITPGHCVKFTVPQKQVERMKSMSKVKLKARQQPTHCSVAPSSDEQRLSTALDVVKNKGKLGFIAQQLMPLLSDCWLEDPVPSAQEILHRLDQVLPTASV